MEARHDLSGVFSESCEPPLLIFRITKKIKKFESHNMQYAHRACGVRRLLEWYSEKKAAYDYLIYRYQ